MRNALKSTPNGKKTKETESTSAKKLKQARLSFKIVPTESSASRKTVVLSLLSGGGEDKMLANEPDGKTEARKRKLSSENESEEPTTAIVQSLQSSTSQENLVISATAAKKKKILDGENSTTIVLLDDDNDDGNNDDGDAGIGTKVEKDADIPPKPPVVGSLSKGAGTPKSGRSKREGNSASKIKIKFPLSAGKSKKSKRRKSPRKSITEDNACDDERLVESSDDIDTFAGEMHSQKKPKLDNANTKQKVDVVDIVCVSSDDGEVSKNIDSNIKEPKDECKAESKDVKSETSAKEVSSEVCDNKTKADEPMSPQADEECKKTKVETDQEAEDNVESAVESTSSSDAADTTEQRNDDQSGDRRRGNAGINMVSKKNLTPKQIKLMDQRRKAREEKERKLHEERMQKQREKEEKDTAKKRDREEREEQRRKEREEKDEHKRNEREERERKRLEEINTRNEEKRKRTEAKEEEVRKKEEDRKRKELEKEEVNTKKKKAADAFTKFFVSKIRRCSIQADLDKSSEHDDTADPLAFRPFQVKGDMKLAPVCRKTLSLNSRCALDALLGREALQDDEVIVRNEPLPKSQLYVGELKTGKTTPHKWTRPTNETKCSDNDDVHIIDTELENAGQAIVEETHGSRERFRAKFYMFQENSRPPYYGTWRKRTNLITPRRPFAQDKTHFDYEIDSDLEWEEEEPGESLNGSDDDKEKESEDDDYEVDNEWFVPHGHLSDEELQHEDEGEIGGQNNNDREAQKAKLKMLQQEFVQEMKKKTQKLKPRLIGCMWVDAHGRKPELCPEIIWDTLTSHAMICAVPPLLEEREPLERVESLSPNTADKGSDKLKRINLTTDILKDLVRLVHGNSNSKAFLIKEFIAHIEATEMEVKNGDLLVPLKSTVREKIDEYAEWQIIDLETIGGGAKKKLKTKKQLCWIVSDDVLQQMDMKDSSLPNTWQYTLQPKTKPVAVSETEPKDDTDADTDAETSLVIVDDDDDSERSTPVDEADKGKRRQSLITIFAQALAADEITKQQQNEMPPPAAPKTPSHTRIAQEATKLSPAAGTTAEDAAQPSQPTTVSKKRVSLLMSVARGQQISQPIKNALISQFLKSSASSKQNANSVVANHLPKDDDVEILE